MSRIRSRDLLVVAVIAVLVSLPGVAIAVELAAPCTGFGECLGPAFAAGIYAVAAPVLLWLGLLIGGVRRHLWIALAATMLALVLATVAGVLVFLVVGETATWPFVVPVAVSAATGAAAAVQRTERPWVVPACLVAGLAIVWTGAGIVSSAENERRLLEELDSFRGQLYAPQLPGAEVTDVWTSSYPEGPAIRYDSAEGTGMVIHLLELEAGGMCPTIFEYGRDECVEVGDVVRFDSAVERHMVALLRGDTVLMAEWNGSPTPDVVLEALRQAKPVSAEELADLG